MMTKKITMTTIIHRDRVEYAVAQDGDQVWHASVKFGRTNRFHAGGAGFREMAQRQEDIAQAYADGLE